MDWKNSGTKYLIKIKGTLKNYQKYPGSTCFQSTWIFTCINDVLSLLRAKI